MAIVVDCPSCGRKLSVPEDSLGTEVKCPRCEHTFASSAAPRERPAPDATIAPMPLSLDDEENPGIPGLPPPPKPFKPVLISSGTGMERVELEEDFDRCTYCRSRLRRGTRRCPTCGTPQKERDESDERDRQPARRDYEPHRGTLISSLGTFSIILGVPGLCGALYWAFALASLVGAGLGIATLVMARGDLKQMERNIIDPDGRASTLTGQTNGFVGTVLGLVGILMGAVVQLSFLFSHGGW